MKMSPPREGKGLGVDGRTSRDTFHTATTGKTTDGRFGNALDVVTEDFTVTLSTAFS